MCFFGVGEAGARSRFLPRFCPMTTTLPLKALVLEGNIGAGKTSLALTLSTFTGHDVFEEQLNQPLFSLMCKCNSESGEGERAWATFSFQMLMLVQRAFALRAVGSPGSARIVDRGMLGDMVFAGVNAHMNDWTTQQRDAYVAQSRMHTKDVAAGTRECVMVWVASSVDTCLQHIQSRGREGEDGLRRDYLERLDTGHVFMVLHALRTRAMPVVAVLPIEPWSKSATTRTLASYLLAPPNSSGAAPAPAPRAVTVYWGAGDLPAGARPTRVPWHGLPEPSAAFERAADVPVPPIPSETRAGIVSCLVRGDDFWLDYSTD